MVSSCRYVMSGRRVTAERVVEPAVRELPPTTSVGVHHVQLTPRDYAMRLPSGDHAGHPERPMTSLRRTLPSTLTMSMPSVPSPFRTASLVPSGDHDGH